MKQYLITEKNPITLKDLPKVSAQEVFNQAANYMLANVTLLDKVRGNGRYVSNLTVENDNRVETLKVMCVAGCFISPKEYNLTLEENNWKVLVNKKLVPAEHGELIHSLQCLFDDDLNLYEESSLYNIWAERLEKIANTYKLKFYLE